MFKKTLNTVKAHHHKDIREKQEREKTDKGYEKKKKVQKKEAIASFFDL